MDKKTLLSIIVSLVLVVSLVIFAISVRTKKMDILPKEEVGEIVVQYIADNFMQDSAPISIIEITEESGLYKIILDIEGTEVNIYATKDGKMFFPEAIKIDASENMREETTTGRPTIGGFKEHSGDVCMENGKPILYYFGNTTCPYCQWQEPVMKAVAESFGDNIVFKSRVDSNEDRDIFNRYSEGGVPLIVVGCKYSRVGAGTNWGEEDDQNFISALNCKLTNNQPSEVCDQLEVLINSI
ncbi:MAG: thioredoxin family protein [Candidatus Nealsonbacteria bacterium]|nr:thioredoxin family protein [Candidatus Nealsonbacteria bacterium]